MKKCHLFSLFLLIAVVILDSGCTKTSDFNEGYDCFSVLAGKNATFDGSVMFAHNEDDSGDQLLNKYKVPSREYSPNDVLVFENGASIPQPEVTNSYIWLELPGMSFSDTYMNQYGVCIGSDACASREDKPEFTGGGIRYSLRKVMAERAKTAREAVKIGGELISEFGYNSSGRTYCIAGPNEVWMMSVVKGKHWVAQRVPDNHVAVIPNYYTIREIDLEDTLNYLGSPDLVDYAIERGWYNPGSGPFVFSEAYAASWSLKSDGNIKRMWRGVNLLSEKSWKMRDKFPFSFIPKKKIELKDLMNILRDHYEGTEFLTKSENPHPNDHRKICTETTQYGFVAQLRSNMPVEIGSVMWIAPRRPCIQSYIPWYSGMTEIPAGFANNTYQEAIKEHFEPSPDIYEPVSDLAYWHYYKEAAEKPTDYKSFIESKHSEINEIENRLLKNQNEFEEKVVETLKTNKKNALKILNEYTAKWTGKTLEK